MGSTDATPRRRSWILYVYACALVSTPVCSETHAQWPQSASTQSALPGAEYVDAQLIVKYKAGTDQFTRRAVQHRLSLTAIHELEFIGAELVSIAGTSVRAALDMLATDPAVLYAEPNYIVHAHATPNDPAFGQLWGMHNTGQTGGALDADIDAVEAWNVRTDGSIIVGVLDSGVDTAHVDLHANIWTNPGEIPGNAIDDDNNGYVDDVYGWDFRNNDDDPIDDFGHGTHVAGTVAAIGNNGIGVTGVCWSARIMPLKFLGASGSGTVANAIRALEYATNMGARVTNNSWGGSAYSQALKDAIDSANARGVLFVVSAGNSRVNIDVSPDYPASFNLTNIITVGATDDQDGLASEPSWGSNYGPVSVDVAAPGVGILSTIPGSAYAFADGTSMAAPHVSGAAALVWSQYPALTHLEVKNRILNFADVISALSGKCLTGARLNAFMSLAEPDSVAPAAITDLRVVKVGGSRATLSWTATGDDGLSDLVSTYDVRYSTLPINGKSFGSSARASGELDPQAPGATESFVVTGLSSNSMYYFAVKALDEWRNASPVSNSPFTITLGPPYARVSPAILLDSLTTGDSIARELRLTNLGEGELLYRTEVEYPDFTKASGRIVIPQATSAPSDDAELSVAHSARTGIETFEIAGEWVSGTVLDVLLVYADGGASALKVILEAYPDIGTVETWKASLPGGSIPPLAVLQNYDVVIAWNNEPWANINAIGDVLADYIDGGGAVVAAVDCWSAGAYASRGRYFDSAGYSPFRSLGEAVFKTRKLGVYDSAHAIMDGVGSLAVATFYNAVELTAGAVDVARWDDGTPLVATNPHTVALNVWPGDGYDWTGDFPTLVHNAVNYARGLVRWLSAVPTTGEVAPSGDSVVNAVFRTRYLNGGDYSATIALHTNDPDGSLISIPVELHVTGVPHIVLSDSLLDFGSVLIDAARVETLAVENRGTAALIVSSLATDHADYTVDVPPFTLEPYERRLVSVTFVPASTGPLLATLAIACSDPDQASVQIPLLGEGLPSPDIVVTPDSLSDSLLRGDAATHTLTIRNDGTEQLAFNVWINTDEASTASAMAKGGGPDAFGYRWRDTRQPSGLEFDWIDASAGTRLSLADEQYVTGIPLGFPFFYYGANFTTLGVASNGWQSFTHVSLDPFMEYLPDEVPDNEPFYHGVIAPFARDIVPAAANYVRYQTTGAAPDRVFVVEYNHIPNYGGGAYKTFELVLYEQSNRLKFQYLVAPDDPRAVGIESPDQTMGIGDGAVGDLYIDPAWVEDRYAIEFSLWPSWIKPEVTSATLTPGATMDLRIRLDAIGLEGGDHRTSIVIASDDPDQPVIEIPVSLQVPSIPDIVVSDTALDFGSVYIGATRAGTLTVSNPGSTVLVVSDIQTNHTDFTVDLSQAAIPPGSSQLVNVRYAPGSAGLVTAELSLQSDDPDYPLLNVFLTGAGVLPPNIVLAPELLSLNMMHGDVSPLTLSIANSGYSPLKFTAATEVTPGAALASGGGPDAFGYRWRDSHEPNGPEFEWIDASDGTSVTLPDDDLIAGIPLGFSFTFYGEDYTTTGIGSNGWLSFVETRGWGPRHVPAADGYSGVIAPFARDLYPPTANYIRYITMGLEPQRCFVVEYNTIPNFAGAEHKTFEAILYEGSNRIRFQYFVVPDTPYGLGIESQDETMGLGDGATGDLHIDPALVEGGLAIEFVLSPRWLRLDTTGGVVPPGSSLDLGVVLDATDLIGGDYFANIEIESDDPDESLIIVPVHLHVTGVPAIAVSDTIIDFGDVFVDGTHSDTLFVTNPGSDVLTISDISCDLPEFYVEPRSLTVAPAESRPVTMSFAPSAVAAFAGILSVFSDAPGSPTQTVSLLGAGVPPPIIAVDRESLVDSLSEEESSTHTIVITNLGLNPLIWSVWPIAGAAGSNRECVLPAAPASEPSAKDGEILNGSDGPFVFASFATVVLQDLTGSRIGFMGDPYSTIRADLAARGATIVPVSFPLAAGILDNLNALAVDDAIEAASSNDLSRIRTWLRGGRGLLVQGDELESMDKINSLLAGAGIAETYSGGYSDAVLTNIRPHLTTTGVDSVNATGYGAYCTTSPPSEAIVLDKLGRVHAAASVFGAGRVLAIGNEICDRRYFGIGQTRLFANQIFDWLVTGVAWLETSPIASTTAPGSSDSLIVTLHAGALEGEHYAARLLVSTNDPAHAQVSIPVRLEIVAVRLGDANGDFRINARDVIYLVNHIYRSGPEPVAGTGDVNCDGVVSLPDVLTMVNYVFKGALLFECP